MHKYNFEGKNYEELINRIKEELETDIDDLMKVNELHELLLQKEITLARKKAKDILKRFESIYHMDEEMLRVSMTSERTDQINEASMTSVANKIHFKLKKPRTRNEKKSKEKF